MRDPKFVFHEALSATGPAYLAAEQELRAMGPALSPVLAAQRTHADPMARLLAEVLQQAAAGSAAKQSKAITFIHEFGDGMEGMVIDTPPPSGLDRSLESDFAAGVVELLALRLIKETGWPDWRVSGVLLYLVRHTNGHPLITVPLIRFAVSTSDEELRTWAVEGLSKQPDEMLLVPLKQERARAEAANYPWPPALLSLENKRSLTASKGPLDLDPLFRKALSSSGPAYVQAEQSLRSTTLAAGDRATASLAKLRHQGDPMIQLLAEVLHQQIAGREDEQQKALEDLEETYLDAMRSWPPTPPDPAATMGGFRADVADRAVEVFALRLSKRPDLSAWWQTVVLLYLDEYSAGHPLITVPLARFAAQTSDAKLRELAIKGLAKQTDAELLGPLQAERARALAAKEPWPSELLALEQARVAAANKPKLTP